MKRRRRRSGAWSAPELDYVRRVFGQRSSALIAKRLRRDAASVRACAVRVFAGRRRAAAWTEDEDLRLRRGFGVVPDADLALSLRRSQRDVRARAAALRRAARRLVVPRPWTGADEAALRRAYGTRSTAALETCLGRRAADIEAAAHRLCLRKDRKFVARAKGTTAMPRWTAADVASLRRLYPVTENLALAAVLARSVVSVANKANVLGLKKRKRWVRQRGRESAGKRWRLNSTPGDSR